MMKVNRGSLLPALAGALTSCSPITNLDATASWINSPEGVVVSIVVADKYTAPLTKPGKVVYIGLGRCADGDDRLPVTGVADGGVSIRAGRVTLRSRPFIETKQVDPGMCTQLSTASMTPFSRHYRTGLIPLSLTSK